MTPCVCLLAGSWDSTVKLWDPRTPCGTGSFSQPDKVYAMAVSGDKLIVGTAKRKVLVWDLRNMGYVQQRRESNLKYQTRCIRAFPNKEVMKYLYYILYYTMISILHYTIQ